MIAEYVRVCDLIEIIKHDGWQLDTRVSTPNFRQYTHPQKPGSVTIAGDLDLLVAPTALKRILMSARLGSAQVGAE